VISLLTTAKHKATPNASQTSGPFSETKANGVILMRRIA
jgi:hypothetical protein